MRAAARAAEASDPVAATEKLYMENTLLRVAGALFYHDKKHAAARTREIELNRGIAEKNILIRPDARLGQPGPLAHKIFIALMRKHASYGPTSAADVSFTKRELMRLVGRAEWGGSASDQLQRALEEIHYAFVRTRFKSRDKFVEHSFNIFPEVYLERRAHANDPIEACTITLARPILASLQDGHFTCLNYSLMQRLGTVGQAMYMRLFFHFANLYDGHHQKRLAFQKRYDDVCAEWLGGLTVRPYLSLIERDQLGPHLRQLVQIGFLASYAIEPAKGRKGFVISFRPGATFFADYERFYRRRRHERVAFTAHGDAQHIAEPLKVAYLFLEKRFGKRDGIPYVPSREVDTARFLLSKLSFAEMPAFLDFALAQARKTHFEVQTLGGLKQYVPQFAEHRHAAAAREKAKVAREVEARATQLRMEYDRFRRAAADQLFARLPAAEQASIEMAARGKAPRFAGKIGSLARTIFELERARLTAERHPNKISTFEQWQRRAH